tara:strand:- start:599 stop:1807 length:1209 start_codon:yes stop_codon:yes gene_type:complete
MKSTKLYNVGQLVSYNSIKKEMICMKNVEIILEKNKIVEVGRNLNDTDNVFNCQGMLVTPGFIDSHTHPVFLNSRNDEFMMRLNGDTYENINKKGGGIAKSIIDVRESTKIELTKKVKNRMDQFLKLGTTTIECKSGYGLNKDSELKSLEIIDNINNNHDIDMIPTFMGAHAIPPEYKSNPDSYVEVICNEIIPAIKKQGIAIFNDVFCEKGYFNEEQSIKILNCGKNHGLIPRLHADEFKNSNGAKVAYETNAISADHLMAVSDEGLNYLKKSNTIATLLPGTTFFLGGNTYAPYDKIRQMGIEVALATDFNPGSCYIKSIPFIMSLACLYLNMPILETLKSVTYVSAKSLRLEKKVGTIEKDMVADILIWDVESLEKIVTKIPNPSIYQIIKNGKFLIKS